jgi:peptide/nickel transport system permease protein
VGPVAVRPKSWWRSSPSTLAAVVFLIVLVVAATFAPVIAPYPPNEVVLSDAYQAPSIQHPMGTDSSGRDILSRIIWGARSALLGPMMVVGVAAAISVTLAIVGAWFGGGVDTGVARLFDALLVLPGLLLALTAAAVFGPGLVAAGLALSIAYIPYIGRITRSAALREVAQPYVAALRLQGFPISRVLLFHLAPNLFGLIVAQITLNLGYAMVDVSALSYLGLGVQPPTPDWGSMVAAGQASILRGYPWESLAAGGAIVLTVLAFNIVGDSLEARFGE